VRGIDGEENLEASVGESWQRLCYFMSSNVLLNSSVGNGMHHHSAPEYISTGSSQMENEILGKWS
jgi:hypothetical protein